MFEITDVYKRQVVYRNKSVYALVPTKRNDVLTSP